MDIMSSPDPINESDAAQQITSSARRITRSQTSVRHYSLGSSPKKQTFELDVGNEISPQKILVTVEAEEATELSNHAVNRRLFQSPTVKRSARRKAPPAPTTMTTTVPLRGLTDDEMTAATDATPRRRGRPRRTGTPAQTRRKRPGTPKAAPQTHARASSRSSVLASETSADDQATPRPAARARTSTKRKASSPLKDSSVSGSQRKRGRPRKQIPLSSELGTVAEQERAMDGEVEDNVSVGHTEESISVAGSRVEEGPVDDMEEDIWLATLSDQPTPIARRSTRTDASIASRVADPPPEALPERAQSEASQPDALHGRYEDWGATESHSDVESLVSDKQGAEERQDTVMASEEFTMISIGSLPSMQQNSSMLASSVMVANQEELGEETSLIINRTLESLRQSQRKPEGAPEAERPSEPLNSKQDLPRAEARSSQPTSPQTSSRSPRRAMKPASLGRQLALKALQGPAPGSPERLPVIEPIEAHETSAYDDSFSEIPEEVLIAATPRRLPQLQTEIEEDTPRLDIQPSIERPSTVNHSNPQSESNRLLTPDETPSPVPSEGEEMNDHEKSPGPTPDQEVHSSPPIHGAVTQKQHHVAISRHSRTQSTGTPAEQVSAYVLNANSVALAPPEPHQRPTLSPIVRAGRALQLVTSDPPSPPGRDSVLRSPFRSSVRSSHSPVPPSAVRRTESPAVQEPTSAKQPEKSWLNPVNQLKSFVAASARVLSPRHAPVLDMEDPFGPNPTGSPVPESVRNFVSSLRGGQPSARQTVGSTAASVPDDEDAMSWPGDGGGTGESSEERSHPHDMSVPGARVSPVENQADIDMHGEEGKEQAGLADGLELIEQRNQDSSDHPSDHEDKEMDDDDDIWAFEAQRPAPTTAKTPPSGAKEADPPRRSKMPSPWWRPSDPKAQGDRPHNPTKADDQLNGLEDMSMLSQQSRQAQEAAPQDRFAPKSVDLSAFFSSPALVPGAPIDGGFGLFRALDVPPPGKLDMNRVGALSESTSIPPVRGPQLFANYPGVQPSPFQLLGAQQSTHKTRRQSRDTLDDEADSAPRPTSRQTTATAPGPSSPTTPAKVAFGHVPQKMNFTPRSRQATNYLFQPRANSLFANNQMPVFSVRAVANKGEEHEDTSPDTSSVRSQLKPLPDRAQSPSKSCMRSPLKPKTTGRVVEFTSSTLSPLAQAQARAERRASTSPEKQLSPVSNVSSAGGSGPEEDKENQGQTPGPQSGRDQERELPHSQPSHVPAPQLPPQSPIKPAMEKLATLVGIQKLSPNKWSYDHWARLDELLQARRQGILQFQLQLKRARGAAARGRSIECQMLLGKWMRARGRQLTVEEWHLDVVDAFRDEVGWWDDVDLAKRVLGLLMGEERRRLGLVPRRRPPVEAR